VNSLKNYIGGEWTTTQSTLENVNPALGEVYSTIPDSGEKEVNEAVQAAHDAFKGWSGAPFSERSRILRKIAEGILSRSSELALAETTDTGKPLTTSLLVDIPRSSLNFEFFADAITQFTTECYSSLPGLVNYTQRSPLGVVACISPWNLPLYLLTWKIAPALAAGNTVIAKPSEVTPMTAFLLSEICHKAGLPKGVLNIIHGRGNTAGSALTRHPKVRAISFTGSTQTGAAISAVAAPLFKKLSLEMGGKNPTILLADANLEKAVSNAVRAAYSNQGQICLCGSRILVERSIYSQVKERMIEEISRLQVGDPLEEATQQGAIVSDLHFKKVLSYIELAKTEGGKILTGGHPVILPGRCNRGWFIAPTLIENLDPHCRTNQEEIFGPVASLTPFDSDAEALEIANSTRYGLSAVVWTNDLKRSHFFANHLEAGMVWVNGWMIRDLRTPFGGMKDSGMGREGGLDALRFFTEQKNICMKLDS
jgi:aminomuconate-semialdehyde/2-hydroxymuconate-6-semialdehyde dehydrogenase